MAFELTDEDMENAVDYLEELVDNELMDDIYAAVYEYFGGRDSIADPLTGETIEIGDVTWDEVFVAVDNWVEVRS